MQYVIVKTILSAIEIESTHHFIEAERGVSKRIGATLKSHALFRNFDARSSKVIAHSTKSFE